MKEKSNIGQTGIESIRLGGMQVSDLPIAEAHDATQQMPIAIESDRQNKISFIKEKYPTQTIGWLDGALKECEATIRNVQGLITEQSNMINAYSGHISLCEHRDKSIERIKASDRSSEDAEIEIKELELQFPPYDVAAMKQQIIQCNEAISRSNSVIEAEHKSMAEIRDVKAQCLKRDAELKSLGVTI